MRRRACEGVRRVAVCAAHLGADARAERLGQPLEEDQPVEVVVPVPDVVKVRADELLLVLGQAEVPHRLERQLLPLAVLRGARARLQGSVRHVRGGMPTVRRRVQEEGGGTSPRGAGEGG